MNLDCMEFTALPRVNDSFYALMESTIEYLLHSPSPGVFWQTVSSTAGQLVRAIHPFPKRLHPTERLKLFPFVIYLTMHYLHSPKIAALHSIWLRCKLFKTIFEMS